MAAMQRHRLADPWVLIAAGARQAAGLRVSLSSLALLIFALAIQASEQKINSSDGTALDQFGYSVGISGEIVVVGSPLDAVSGNIDQGSAYVFTRDGGVWTEHAKLTARDGGARDEFGFAVAIRGNTVAVGSRKRDVGTNEDQGVVSIFERGGAVWTEVAELTAMDGEAGDLFGHSVAIDGDTLVVGAPLVDVDMYASYGAVYVFVRAEDGWAQQAVLKATDGFTSDNFGQAVAIDDDTLVVGVGGHDPAGRINQGAVYVYVRHGTVWHQQAKLTAADGLEYDDFGRSVAISNNTVLVGSLASVGANAYQGAAYVFALVGAVWTQQAKLAAPDGAYNDRFGFAVGLDRDMAIVGSFGDDVGDNVNQGSAYVFARREGAWIQTAKLIANDGQTFDNFGFAVGIDGDDIVVGAAGDDEAANLDQGAAFLFRIAAGSGRRRSVRK